MPKEQTKQLTILDKGALFLKGVEWGEMGVQSLKELICPDAPDRLFVTYLYLAKRYQLDPLQNQIMLVPFGGKHQVFIGVHGLRALAHRSGQFASSKKTLILNDGQEVEFCNDFDKVDAAKCVIQKYNEKTGKTHEFSFIASRNSYYPEKNVKKDTSGFLPWSKMPDVMLLKCAEAGCLREAFSLVGYDEAEMYNVQRKEKDITNNVKIIEQTDDQKDKIKELRENPLHRKLAINLFAIYQNDAPATRTKLITEYCQKFNWEWAAIEKDLHETNNNIDISDSIIRLIVSKGYSIPYSVNLFDKYSWNMENIEAALSTSNGQPEMFEGGKE
jgi:phage recombination protein Bet